MPYVCDTCMGSFKNPQALKIHQKSHGILEPITGGNTEMADSYCKDCYSKDRENDKLNHKLKEVQQSSRNELDNLKNQVSENQGHVSAKELIQCQAHGPDAVKELNRDFIMFPKEDLKVHEKKVEIAGKIFPEFADILTNGIELPDGYFTGKHND
jgi:hypothetical protein